MSIILKLPVLIASPWRDVRLHGGKPYGSKTSLYGSLRDQFEPCDEVLPAAQLRALSLIIRLLGQVQAVAGNIAEKGKRAAQFTADFGWSDCVQTLPYFAEQNEFLKLLSIRQRLVDALELPDWFLVDGPAFREMPSSGCWSGGEFSNAAAGSPEAASGGTIRR
jgi:hypothetical protein